MLGSHYLGTFISGALRGTYDGSIEWSRRGFYRTLCNRRDTTIVKFPADRPPPSGSPLVWFPCACKVTSMPWPVPTCIKICEKWQHEPGRSPMLPRATLRCGLRSKSTVLHPSVGCPRLPFHPGRVQAPISGCGLGVQKKDYA